MEAAGGPPAREIIARSHDHRTFIRFAATCRILRCDILSPPFDARVTQAAPCMLANLLPDAKKPLALLHPTTPAASSFCISRLLSRKAAKILYKYRPVTSCHGLVLLRRRRNLGDPTDASRHMCVYDPMSGAQSFFSNPPDTRSDCDCKYVLLTAADGIDTNSFMLLAFDFLGSYVTVHTATSRGTWGSVRVWYESFDHREYFPWWMLKKRGEPAILTGGVIHWLHESGSDIISYDFGTRKMGLVKFPFTNCDDGNLLYLATSTEEKTLKLLSIQGFMMFVWVQLPVSAADGSGWSLETVIDMKENIRSFYPYISRYQSEPVEFEGSGKRTGEVVFLQMKVRGYNGINHNELIVFDLEAKKMHRQMGRSALLEIDLPFRLQTMKIFS